MAEAADQRPQGLYVDCLTPFLEKAERERVRAARAPGSVLVRHEGRWMLMEPSALAPRAVEPAELTDAELRLIAESASSTDRDRALANLERDDRYMNRAGKSAMNRTAEESRRLVADYVRRFGAEDALVQDVERFVCSTGRGIFDFYRTVRDAIESGEAVSAERWEALKARAREQWPEDVVVGCHHGDPAMAWPEWNRSWLQRVADRLRGWLRRVRE